MRRKWTRPPKHPMLGNDGILLVNVFFKKKGLALNSRDGNEMHRERLAVKARSAAVSPVEVRGKSEEKKKEATIINII